MYLFGDHARQVAQRVLFQYSALTSTSGIDYGNSIMSSSLSLPSAVVFIQVQVFRIHQDAVKYKFSRWSTCSKIKAFEMVDVL